MARWSTAEKLGLATLVVNIITMLAALLVVPGVGMSLGLEPKTTAHRPLENADRTGDTINPASKLREKPSQAAKEEHVIDNSEPIKSRSGSAETGSEERNSRLLYWSTTEKRWKSVPMAPRTSNVIVETRDSAGHRVFAVESK